MALTPVLNMTELPPQPGQPDVTVNEFLNQLEAKTVRVLSRTTTAQPAGVEGAAYIMPASPTGTDWGTYAQHDIAHYVNGAWEKYTPKEGWRVWVNDEDVLAKFNASTWVGVIGEDANGNVTLGTAAIATTATDGFLYIPTCAGTPTGTPTTKTGQAPLVIDSTNNKMYIYSGGWVALN